jgi:hypothetical protein
MFAGSIFGLKPATTYECEFTISMLSLLNRYIAGERCAPRQ